jgi:N-acetylglucosamine kinase-like BadF-type ATPase
MRNRFIAVLSTEQVEWSCKRNDLNKTDVKPSDSSNPATIRSADMNEMEKYLDAIAAAVETNDKKAIELLDGFATYVYHELYAKTNSTSGEESIVWDGMQQRIKVLLSKMVEAKPDIW